MTLPKNVAELRHENVLFELECIDRMFLNLYVPQLTSAQGVAAYFRGYKGHRFASTKEAVATSEGFRRQVFDFAERHGIPIIRFEKGMRKDDVMHKRLRKFKAPEGVVFIGIAQEKARVPRTIRKRFGKARAPSRGSTTPRPWLTTIIFTAWTKLWTLLHQVLLLLSLYGQALHQRARVSQQAVGRARHRIRSARQRALALREPGDGAAHRRGFR